MTDDAMFIILMATLFIGLGCLLWPMMCSFAIERKAEKLNGKLSVNAIKAIYLSIGFVFFVLFIGSLRVLLNSEHLNSTYTYETYPIEELTFNSVSFDDTSISLGESYVIVEEPNNEYQNVVVEETENYKIKWFCNVECDNTTYHVYLSEDVYERLQNRSVIYEAKELD